MLLGRGKEIKDQKKRYTFKVRLHQRYFDFKRDLKISLPRFNAKREIETERVLSLA